MTGHGARALRGVLLTAIVSLCLVAAPTAGASTYSYKVDHFSVLEFQGGSAANRVTWEASRDQNAITDTGSLLLPDLTNLGLLLQTLQSCSGLLITVVCEDGQVGAVAFLGAGNDTIHVTGADDSPSVSVNIDDGPGADSVVGGPGSEVVYAAPGPDDIHGGAGLGDQMYYTFGADPVSVSLDDVANDGRPGEADNIHSDVERIQVYRAAHATLIGSDGANELNVGSPGGTSDLDGRGGDDILRGNNAASTVSGGSGQDLIVAFGGADIIDVLDGEIDTVDCGDGTDTVTADATDVLVHCENVSLP